MQSAFSGKILELGYGRARDITQGRPNVDPRLEPRLHNHHKTVSSKRTTKNQQASKPYDEAEQRDLGQNQGRPNVDRT